MSDLMDFQLSAQAQPEGFKPFAFLRVGTFRDRNGREFSVTSDLLDRLAANFRARKADQDIPIDIQHRRDEATGWISSLFRDGDVLYAVPNWNELGRQLVGDKVYRYVSATIDIGAEVLRSISLTNFPAVRGLPAVELSADAEGAEHDPFVDEMPSPPLAPATNEELQPPSTELSQEQNTMSKKAQPQAEPDVEPTQVVETPAEPAPEAELTAPAPAEDSVAYVDELARFKEQIGDIIAQAHREAAVQAPPVIEAEAPKPAVPLEAQPAAQPAAKPVGGLAMTELVRELFAAELSTFKAQVQSIVSGAHQEAAKMTTDMVDAFKQSLREEQQLAELSARLTSQGKHALPVTQDDLFRTLKSLPQSSREGIVSLLTTIAQSGTVDFTEIGTSAEAPRRKQTLDPQLQQSARHHIQSGGTIAEWFEFNSDLVGDADQYDLSAFEK